ncbi:MAG: hypothetical protein ACI4RA_08580 [Kiritimatiellia bacterium]
MKRRLLKIGALGALVLAGMPADAMPVGVRLAMHGRAAAAEAANAVFPVLPGDASAETIAGKLSVATDKALVANITDIKAYSNFRSWATSVGVAEVKTAATAWLSYAVGAAGIVPAPKDGDLAFEYVSVGPDGKLEAVFALDGVDISSTALESRLKTVFIVEGATVLDDKAFSDRNIRLSLLPTGDGRVRARVEPPADAENSFFVRVRVK